MSAAVTVRPGGADDFFVECVHANPSTAARVSNVLASLLVEEAERERANGADALALEARLVGARKAMEERADAVLRSRGAALDVTERLVRDYDQARKAYLALEEEWRAAEAASRIGGSGRVRFTVLQPATAPRTPFFPNPVLFALAGAALGLLSGLGAAVLVELRDPSVKGPEDLRELLPHALLAEIPLVRVRRSERRPNPTPLSARAGRRA